MNERNAMRKRKRTLSKEKPSLKKWKITLHNGGRDLRTDDRDIILRLNGCMMDSVVEQIFGYLDFESLLNAERVSPEWRAILEKEKIWKSLLKRNVQFDSCWRRIYHQIKDQATQGLAGTNDDLFMSKKICVHIGNLQRQLLGVLSSMLNVMNATSNTMSKLLETLQLVFGLNSRDEILDLSDMDSD